MKRKLLIALMIVGVPLVGVPSALLRSTQAADAVDRTRLRLGKTSSQPARDALWTCRSSYPENAVGAFAVGSWIRSDGTWDLSKKLIVDGAVSWPTASQTVKRRGTTRALTGNGLPKKATTGAFPISSTDDAYTVDRNPNSISAQRISLVIPAKPKVLSSASCVENAVGVAVDGPPIFNAVDEAGRDAVAYEVQDSCSGHPEVSGTYHYHGLSACAPTTNGQYGWALDGFAIWGPVDPVTGKTWSNAQLDECHGTTSKITIDGKPVTAYHYVANDEFPYTVGCFRGTPVKPLGLGSPPPPR
jgi:YHYH protein